jgi:hypothetical protein
VLEDFIDTAGVARSTFCKHFKAARELRFALAAGVIDEVLQVVGPLVPRLVAGSPAQRGAVCTVTDISGGCARVWKITQ